MFRDYVRRSLSVAAFLVGASVLPAQAAIIVGAGSVTLPGFSTGIIGPFGSNPAPNNDSSPGPSPNSINYSIFYNAQGVGFTDVEYIVADSGGTTEYRITQTLINNTGQSWNGMRFELGFGTGSAFVRSAFPGLLDFDAPLPDPTPTSSVFPSLIPRPDVLQWTGAIAPSISVVQFAFSIDVPDGLPAVNPFGQNRFTLRQLQLVEAPSTVPEPGGLALLAAAAAACLLAGRARPRIEGTWSVRRAADRSRHAGAGPGVTWTP